MDTTKVFLIHATPLAVAPVKAAFAQLWPEVTVHNIMDDMLTPDLQKAGQVNAALTKRISDLCRIAKGDGASAVLYTCSAFGDAIDAVKTEHAFPVLKPNEAMFDEALAICKSLGRRTSIGLITTFAPASLSMKDELGAVVLQSGLSVDIYGACADGAMAHLNAGDKALHDQMVTHTALAMPACDVYLLGQFSMAHLQDALAKQLQKPVLSSPASAVLSLKNTLTS